MRLALNKKSNISNTDTLMLISPISLDDNEAQTKIKLVILMQPINTWQFCDRGTARKLLLQF